MYSNKTKNSSLLTIFLCAVLLVSCQKAPFLSGVGLTDIEMSIDGGSRSITFMANQKWTASSSDTWVEVSPASGEGSDAPVTVTIRCEANTTYNDRNATITVRMEDISQTWSVNQPANSGFIVPTQAITLPSEAGDFEIEIQSNVNYTVDISDKWIKRNETKGLPVQKLSFRIEENVAYDNRLALIIIRPEGGFADHVIEVVQEAKECFEVYTTSFWIGVDGGNLGVRVRTNAELEVVSDVSWISSNQTKGATDETVYIMIDKNTEPSTREADVTVRTKSGKNSQVIHLQQNGRITTATAVDLGVTVTREDGSTYKLYWAESNLGASKPEEYGDCYAWGETETKTTYSWDTYKWSVRWSNDESWLYSKYCPSTARNSWGGAGAPDDKIVLDLEDDAAHAVLGGAWRMATKEEWTALLNQCDWSWVDINGIYGFKIVSRELGNDNNIFLPAAGYRQESGGLVVYTNQSNVCYWTSTLHTPSTAWDFYDLFFTPDDWFRWNNCRICGQFIRPVTE